MCFSYDEDDIDFNFPDLLISNCDQYCDYSIKWYPFDQYENIVSMLKSNDNTLFFFEDLNGIIHDQFFLFIVLTKYNKKIFYKVYKVKLIQIFLQQFCNIRSNKIFKNFMLLMVKLEYYKILQK